MRIHPQDFCMSDAMPFQQHYECRTEYPIDEIILNRQALMSVRGNLRVGDRITICSYNTVNQKSGVSEGLTGIANARVSHISAEAVDLVLEGDLIFVEEAIGVKEEEEPEVLLVKKIFGGGFGVFDEDDNIIEQFKTKKEAGEFVDHFALEEAA